MRRLATSAVLTVVALAAGCGGSTPTTGRLRADVHGPRLVTTSAVSPAHVSVSWHRVVSGLDNPVYVTSAHDGSGRLFVVEQPGAVRRLHSGVLAATPYLDIRSEVDAGGERGLLSVAFHPHFAKHPLVYVAYTRSNGDLVVASLRAKSAKASKVAASTQRTLLIVPHRQAANHNGGQLFLGKGGNLYITTGDGGGANDQFNHADYRTNLNGKMLRIDVNHRCGKRNYCIPKSNPFAKSTTLRREIVAWGLRNPWRASIDPADGTVWIGDVGQGAYEEVDHVGTKHAHDFGWSCKEGRTTFNASKCGHRSLTGPVAVYSHDPGGNCAIIGGYVYRGRAYAAVARGLYVFGDYCSGTVWGTSRNAKGRYVTATIGSVNGGLTGFGTRRGELYAVTGDGVLYRASFAHR
jgi:glucose/arabinose dehydrogenase